MRVIRNFFIHLFSFVAIYYAVVGLSFTDPLVYYTVGVILGQLYGAFIYA